ncbi:MAG: hypothetical protein ACRDOL_41605 [Streptosporangiaceae bacterium]
MGYKWFRSRGLFVGSSVVEAGCKTIPARPETVGMHWTVVGAVIALLLRGEQPIERIWQRPRNQTATA